MGLGVKVSKGRAVTPLAGAQSHGTHIGRAEQVTVTGGDSSQGQSRLTPHYGLSGRSKVEPGTRVQGMWVRTREVEAGCRHIGNIAQPGDQGQEPKLKGIS